MDKKEIQPRLKYANGIPLPLNRFSWKWDEKRKIRIFSSILSGITVDFSGIDNLIIIVRDRCKVFTGNNCIIYSGYGCDIETGDNCIIYGLPICAFVTINGICDYHVHLRRPRCTYNEESGCVHSVAGDSALLYRCTFKTGKNCKIIRKDKRKNTGKIINPPPGQRIKLNKSKGYQIAE